jgi:ribonuclease-3
MNNIKNKLIKKEDIENIINHFMGETPIKVNNIKQFQKAFVHKSFGLSDPDNSDSDNYCALNVDKHSLRNNERLEFLGDKVIDLITTEYLFDNFPEENEGFMTRTKSKLVKKESLSKLGYKLGFKEFILMSSHVERISGRNNERFLEDIFESFIGILYKDQHSNLNICKKFLLGVYAEHIDINKLIAYNDNYKDSLLRYFYSRGWSHPVYRDIYDIGPTYGREFTTIVLINSSKCDLEITDELRTKQREILNIIKAESSEGYENTRKLMKDDDVLLGIGKSDTKKKSEQMCSKDCLINLKIPLNY